MLHTTRLTFVIFKEGEKRRKKKNRFVPEEQTRSPGVQTLDWCSGYAQLKATQFFTVTQTPPSPPLSSPPPHHSLHHHQPPFSPAAVTRATGNSKSCCRATAGSMLPALEETERERARARGRQRESGRERERDRAPSLSTKRYYCLATSHALPSPPTITTTPHHPVSLSRGGRSGGSGGGGVGHEKYTVRGPLWKIIMGCLLLGWLWSFSGKAYIMHKLPRDGS